MLSMTRSGVGSNHLLAVSVQDLKMAVSCMRVSVSSLNTQHSILPDYKLPSYQFKVLD